MYNQNTQYSIDDNYQHGFLPQRNKKGNYYLDTSCRSSLNNFSLSSENRRIINKTQDFSFKIFSTKDFDFNIEVKKTIFSWLKILGWDFPISSVKTVFTNHIFNTIYVWYNSQNQIVAYSVGYFSDTISHIAYVFYDPQYSRSNLPIRLTLQFIIDSQAKNLSYCYLGRFDPQTKLGYYKRNMPGFEYFLNNNWIQFKENQL
jgi:arginyl-tRNA--protein-N-Asp/Glu arginylyltransferase